MLRNKGYDDGIMDDAVDALQQMEKSLQIKCSKSIIMNNLT